MTATLIAIGGPLVALLLILAVRRAPAMIALVGAVVGVMGGIGGVIDVAAGGDATFAFGGLPELPLRIQHDPLTSVLSLTVAVVALLVFVYAVGYMQADAGQVRFYAQMTFFVVSMHGLVVAGDWLLLLACWELIGLASYLLIGFWYERPHVPGAATRAFLTTRGADLGLYVAVFALVTRSGTTELAPTLVSNHGQVLIGMLLLVAAMGKAAQVPFQGWLQDAMLGPTPVSGLLHSATLVAAGAILLIRSAPLFSTSMLTVVAAVGGLTILLTGVMALAQSDLKRMLAASTSSQLGFMLLAVGAGSPVAALCHLVAHAAMKAALFLGAGIFQHARKSTLFGDLHGAGRAYPVVFGLFGLDGLALAGVPPLAGFWSKDAIEAATLESPNAALFLGLALIGSGLTGAYVARALRLLWFGSAESRSVSGLRWMVLGLAGLTLLSATLGAVIQPIAHFVGGPLPDNTVRLLGLGASLAGLAMGWFGLAERLVAPIALAAHRGFRPGNGWIDVAVRPALVLARACDRVDRGLYAFGLGVGHLSVSLAGGFSRRIDAVVEAAVVGVGMGGLGLAYAARQFDEANLDGLIAWFVKAIRTLGARARSLQTGFVSRELVVAAAGAAGVFILALAAR